MGFTCGVFPDLNRRIPSMSMLKEFLHRERFEPGIVGLFTNPFWHARRGLLRELRNYFPKLTGEVLDVGCGRKPYRRFVQSTRYVGVDVDTPVTRELAVADVYYDGKKLPFPDMSFDAVLCSQVLEHVFEPDDFLREICRVLRPGGKLLLAVPFAWDEHEQPYDFARYSSFGLAALLQRSGFEIVDQSKSVGDLRAVVQLLSGLAYKMTRSRIRPLNWLAQFMVIAPINILGGAVAWLLPKNPDFYLDNIVLAKKTGSQV